MLKRFFIPFLLVAAAALPAVAQGELLATVRINTPQLQQTDRKVFDELEISLKDFINNTKWTKDQFDTDERIKCNFILTISSENENGFFGGELAVQSVRPAYGSGYETPMLSHLDKDISFYYVQSMPIEFLPDATDNQNIAALFAFYAYIILGLDYDSYSLYGGEPYFLVAQQIVTNIENSSTNANSGWRPKDGGKNRNRWWIVENMLNPRIKPYRAAQYQYHRNGLDVFYTNPEQGRNVVLSALEEIDKANTAYFNAMIVQMFTNSKRDEIVEMWKAAPKSQRDRVIQIMTKIDPTFSQRYREIN
ncbi:MAG: DUF4835 family protein [Saprospiraceae bacterium]|nr:DUF4835 family protein [Saprospiraceae bacterium]